MGVKDRFRRAISKRSDRSSSSSNSSTSQNTPIPSHPATGTSTPIPQSATPTSAIPSITLTKTTTSSSRLGLSKTLTWGRSSKLTPEEKERKRIEEWRKKDEKAWDEPRGGAKYSGRKSKAHQDILRAFEWRFRERGSMDGRSMFSGISPGQSRVGSVDDGRSPRGSMARKRSEGVGKGMLSREVSREEVEVVPPHGVGSIAEE